MAKDDSILPISGKFLTDNLKSLYATSIQQLIADLGREIVLTMPPSTSGCPNCIYSALDEMSMGRYNPDNPYEGKPYNIPFPDNMRCPVCFPAGTIVHTNSALLPIEDIVCSKYNIIDAENQKRDLINGFITEYSGDLIELGFDGHTNNFSCTPDHKIHIMRRYRYKTIKAKDIKYSDYVIMPIGKFKEKGEDIWNVRWQQYCSKFYHKDTVQNIKNLNICGMMPKNIGNLIGKNAQTIRKIINEKIKGVQLDCNVPIDNDLLFLIGWYIAEGCVNSSESIREITYALHIKEMPIAKKLVEIFNKKFNIKGRIETRKKRPNSLWVHFCSAPIARWLADVCGIGSHNKKIPEYLYNNLSIDSLQLLCEFIVDGDGHRRNREVVLGTTSNVLAHQVFSIWQSLQFLPYLLKTDSKIRKDEIRRKEVWSISYTTNLSWQGCDRKISKNKELRRVKSIKRKKNVDLLVYNINVDGSHTYIANNVAVDNCKGSHQIKTRRTATWRATIVKSPKEINYEKYGVSPENTVLTKTVIDSFSDIINCKRVKIDGLDYVKLSDPAKIGLGSNSEDLKFVNTIWKRAS